MASVDNGIIVRSDEVWLTVRPRCPYCGHVEGSWSEISLARPSRNCEKYTSTTCSKCRKGYKITAYPGWTNHLISFFEVNKDGKYFISWLTRFKTKKSLFWESMKYRKRVCSCLFMPSLSKMRWIQKYEKTIWIHPFGGC